MKQIFCNSLLAVLCATVVGVVPSLAQYDARIPVATFKKSGDGFVLVGNIDGVNGKVYMTEAGVPNAQIIDSTVAINGRFSFKGVLSVPVMVTLIIPGQIAFMPFFIENSDMMVYGRQGNREIDVYGSITDKKYRERNRQINEIMEKRLSNRDFGEMTSELNRLNMNFVDNNPNSVVSAFILFSELVNSLPLQAIKYKIDGFSETVKKSVYVRELKAYIDAVEATGVGRSYVDVAAADVKGNVRKLSDMVGKGKYILLNFWGSWCVPCQAVNRTLNMIHKEYASFGFDMYSVAIDRNFNEWAGALKREPINGTNVSNLNLWKCSIAATYGVNTVPMMILIAPDGKIVERGSNITELRAKLSNIFRKNLSSIIN